MKSTINEFFKENLFKRYLLCMFGGVLIIFITFLGFNYYSSIKSEKEKIQHLIQSNKEDLFNALILEEYSSLETNLDFLKNEYHFDFLTVEYKGILLQSDRDESLSQLVLSNLYGVNYSKKISNDFGTISFVVTFSFGGKVFYESVLPSLKVFLLLVVFLVGAQYVFYKKHKSIIEMRLVSPLTQLAEAIEKEEYDFTSLNSDQIYEVSILSNAVQKFRDIRYAQLHNEIVNQFAHDVKTPLNAIKRIIAQDPYFRSERMDYLKMSLDRIENVSRDLLLMRKNRENASLVEIRPFEVIKKIYKEFLLANGISYNFLSLKKSTDLTFSTYIDNNIFERIVSNILVNSWDAIKNKETPRLTVSIKLKEKNIEITFLDNGEGISEDNIKNIFTDGFTTKKEGNGLGLSFAKKYLISVGGDIVADSEADIFTKISILMPVVTIIKDKVESKNRKIILIDDDRYNHIPIKNYCFEKKIEFDGYLSLDEFYSNSDSSSGENIILLDSHLGNGIRGEKSLTELAVLGFQKVYLYTSAVEADLVTDDLHSLQGIIQKSDISKIDKIVSNTLS